MSQPWGDMTSTDEEMSDNVEMGSNTPGVATNQIPENSMQDDSVADTSDQIPQMNDDKNSEENDNKIEPDQDHMEDEENLPKVCVNEDCNNTVTGRYRHCLPCYQLYKSYIRSCQTCGKTCPTGRFCRACKAIFNRQRSGRERQCMICHSSCT